LRGLLNPCGFFAWGSGGSVPKCPPHFMLFQQMQEKLFPNNFVADKFFLM